MRRRSQTIGKQHPLTQVLTDHGYSLRAAQKIVNAIFDAIKGALRRHETVELPFGVLKVVENKVQPYRRWCWKRPVEFYQKRYRVVFEPRSDE